MSENSVQLGSVRSAKESCGHRGPDLPLKVRRPSHRHLVTPYNLPQVDSGF